jgi:putative phosphoribosyl transferase
VGPPFRLVLAAVIAPGDRFSERFSNRADAGDRLARRLEHLRDSAPVVLGMARGGVAVAQRVAAHLGAPLDVVLVRKLGHPAQPELGLGAIGEGGVRILNEPLLARLAVVTAEIEAITAAETAELERRLRRYRADRPLVPLQGRTVIVVDDGLATGFTALAAVASVRGRRPARIVLAVPVGSPGAVALLEEVADSVVCLENAARFSGISQGYVDFHQVGDDEVTRLLAGAPAPATHHSLAPGTA